MPGSSRVLPSELPPLDARRAAELLAMDETQYPPSRVEAAESWRSEAWHPRFTPYRLLVTVVTIGLGTAKAVESTKYGGTAASITIEWIAGIVVLLVTFFLNYHEANDNAKPHWLFMFNVVDSMRSVGIPIPVYATEERPSQYLIRPKRPHLTGYRILVSASATAFGLAKALLSYRGVNTAPTAVEWIYGVVITVSLYWLGMYEVSSSEVMPWLFVVDYSKQVYTLSFTIGFTALHLVALYAAHWWSSSWYGGVKDMLHSGWSSGPNISTSEAFFNNLFVLMWLVMAIGLGVGVGVAGACVVLVSLGGLLVPWLLVLFRACLRMARRLAGHSQNDFDDEATLVGSDNFSPIRNWLKGLRWPSMPTLSTSADGGTGKRAVKIFLFIAFAILYTLAHGVAFIITFGWTMMWFYGLRALWTQGDNGFFIWAFTIFWSAGACMAMVAGTYGTLAVVLSFFSVAYAGRFPLSNL